LRSKAQAKMQSPSKDESEEKHDKKTVDVDKRKTEKVSKKTNKDTVKKTKKIKEVEEVEEQQEEKTKVSKKETEDKKKVKRSKKQVETETESEEDSKEKKEKKRVRSGNDKKKKTRKESESSDSEKEDSEKETKKRSKKEAKEAKESPKKKKRSKKEKESEESEKEGEIIKVFNKERKIEDYNTANLRKFAGKVKMEGRSKLNKEKLYEELMKIDYVIDLDSEEEEMLEFDKNKEIEFYNTKQLKFFTSNIYLKGRTELKSKEDLYNALKKYYDDELYLNPSMAPKNLKEFTTNFTVDQYTRSQLYELGKSKKLKVRRDMNKDTLYEFLSNPDKQVQNDFVVDQNTDVFQLMTKYKVTKTYNVDNNTSKLLHLTSGKKQIYVLFCVGEHGVDCKSLSKEDFDVMIQ